VPATPVVLINIEADQVTVNGVAVEHDGSRSLHQVGVHAAAERVAQVLQRPVRVIATDATSRTRLVVHPNGTATDLEVLEETHAPVDDQDGSPSESETIADVIALGDRREANAPLDPARQSVPVVVSRERRRRPALLVLVGSSVALVAALSAAAVAVSTGGPPAEPQRPAAVSPAPPSPSYQVQPGATLSPTPATLHVAAAGGPTTLQLEISSSRRPVRARIVVDPAGAGPVIVKEVWLRDSLTTVVIRDVPSGRAHWSVVADTAHAVTGATKVAAKTAPQPSSTYSPSPTAAPSTSSGAHGGPTKGSGGTPPPTGPVGINDSPAPGPIGG